MILISSIKKLFNRLKEPKKTKKRNSGNNIEVGCSSLIEFIDYLEAHNQKVKIKLHSSGEWIVQIGAFKDFIKSESKEAEKSNE